jgi:putative transposase
MGLSRSTYYDVPSLPIDDAALVATMIAICDEFEAYGYRSKSKAPRFRQSFPAIGLNSGRQ